MPARRRRDAFERRAALSLPLYTAVSPAHEAPRVLIFVILPHKIWRIFGGFASRRAILISLIDLAL